MSDVFSYSRINTFKNCRELYHINYIQGIRKDNENIEAYLGTCVHSVIEDIYNANNQGINFDEIVDMYKKKWEDNWHDNIFLIDRTKKAYQYYDLGIECLRNFYRKNIHNNTSFLDNVLDSELEVEFSIEGIAFRGIIDRLDFDPDLNKYSINDYKTSKRIISSKQAQKNLQLGLYLVAIHEKFNVVEPVDLRWYFLRYGVDVMVTSGFKDLEYVKKALVKKAKNIIELSKENENFYANETILCNWCHYWEECNAKTAPNPARRILK